MWSGAGYPCSPWPMLVFKWMSFQVTTSSFKNTIIQLFSVVVPFYFDLEQDPDHKILIVSYLGGGERPADGEEQPLLPGQVEPVQGLQALRAVWEVGLNWLRQGSRVCHNGLSLKKFIMLLIFSPSICKFLFSSCYSPTHVIFYVNDFFLNCEKKAKTCSDINFTILGKLEALYCRPGCGCSGPYSKINVV